MNSVVVLFKYYNFFIENVDYVLQAFHFKHKNSKIILPIGFHFTLLRPSLM